MDIWATTWSRDFSCAADIATLCLLGDYGRAIVGAQPKG